MVKKVSKSLSHTGWRKNPTSAVPQKINCSQVCLLILQPHFLRHDTWLFPQNSCSWSFYLAVVKPEVLWSIWCAINHNITCMSTITQVYILGKFGKMWFIYPNMLMFQMIEKNMRTQNPDFFLVFLFCVPGHFSLLALLFKQSRVILDEFSLKAMSWSELLNLIFQS